ncbi:MAG: prolyl oligopeptidase family serine peptidase [Prevotella sp.]|nr:prolyl oligopeptidase family serine peptidase [Prevotella sp.]
METARPMNDGKSISGGTVDMLAAVKRILDAPVNWYQAESVTEKNVSSRVYALSPSPSFADGTPFVTYRQGDKKFMVDGRTGKSEPFSQDKIDAYKRQHPAKAQNDRLSFGYGDSSHTADSAFTMLGDRFNLHIRDNRTGEVKQLTTDGREYASYCGRGAKDQLSERNASGFWKGHSYFCMVYDDTDVAYLNIVHSTVTPQRLEQKKMPLPGGNGIRRFRLYWYNADTREGRLLDIAPNRDYNIQLDYDRSGSKLTDRSGSQLTDRSGSKLTDRSGSLCSGAAAAYQYFLRRSRSVDTLELCRIDPQSGDVHVVISEVCKPHVNVNMFKYQLIDHGRQVLWWSDRTGRGNYYLYDGISGKLLNRVTQGDRLVAGRIEKLDPKSRTLIFLGYGQEPGDPNYTYYYKVNLNGRNQQLLTYGNGEHSLQLSNDGKWGIDQYSRMDMPPVYNVVSIDNPKNRHEFFRTSEEACLKAGWVKPTLIKVKAADEQTDLYGVMYLPSDSSLFTLHSSLKKLPIISNVYPGPQDDQIPRRFTVDENGNQSLAELGFVVINVQPRGSSPLRDKDFYCYGYGNLRDYPVADDKHTIETLARQYSFIDTTRVGIYGHSGGGFETVTAMLTYPDFYKVGVSASGNHDNSQYIQWWAETYHGYGKPIPTNMELADRLKGRLLLMTGEVDENVPVASTYRLANALQKAGKRFDMMIFPEQGHGLYGDYYQNIIRYYFLDHLVHPEKVDLNIVKHQ